MSKADGKKAAARSGNYQDNVTIPLAREHDDNATADVEPDGDDVVMDVDAAVVQVGTQSVPSAIEKVGNLQICRFAY
jgi:hypothetical protein